MALNYVKIYKKEVEIQIGSKLKRLRTYKGGEYYDLTYFNSLGIIHWIRTTIKWYGEEEKLYSTRDD